MSRSSISSFRSPSVAVQGEAAKMLSSVHYAIARHEETLRRIVPLTLLYLILVLPAMLPILDPDIWWHLRTGQWIVEHATVPTTDLFSSYGIGKPWIAYSWLFEVL